jgi:hypothetical protein
MTTWPSSLGGSWEISIGGLYGITVVKKYEDTWNDPRKGLVPMPSLYLNS